MVFLENGVAFHMGRPTDLGLKTPAPFMILEIITNGG